MPRHNPTTSITDDGHGRHERRLERDDRARARRRARRLKTVSPDGFGRLRLVPRQSRDEGDVERQVADWRAELVLLPRLDAPADRA